MKRIISSDSNDMKAADQWFFWHWVKIINLKKRNSYWIIKNNELLQIKWHQCFINCAHYEEVLNMYHIIVNEFCHLKFILSSLSLHSIVDLTLIKINYPGFSFDLFPTSRNIFTQLGVPLLSEFQKLFYQWQI